MSEPNNIQVIEEFKKKLSTISHVYIIAQEAYLYTEYFHNPNTKEELDFVVKSNQLRLILDSTSPTFDKKRFMLLKLMVKGENQRQEELLNNAKKMIDEMHNKLQG